MIRGRSKVKPDWVVTKRGLRVRPPRDPDPLPNFAWPRFVVRYRPYDHEWDGM